MGEATHKILVVEDDRQIQSFIGYALEPVSYTHLTLPTIYSV